jgi:hypothetical protein
MACAPGISAARPPAPGTARVGNEHFGGVLVAQQHARRQRVAVVADRARADVDAVVAAAGPRVALADQALDAGLRVRVGQVDRAEVALEHVAVVAARHVVDAAGDRHGARDAGPLLGDRHLLAGSRRPLLQRRLRLAGLELLVAELLDAGARIGFLLCGACHRQPPVGEGEGTAEFGGSPGAPAGARP